MFGRIHQWTHLGLVLPPFQLAREVWEESIVILYMFGGIHHDSISLHVWWNSAAKASGPVLCFIGRFLIIDSISFFVSYNFYWLKFILSDIERVTCSSLVTVCMEYLFLSFYFQPVCVFGFKVNCCGQPVLNWPQCSLGFKVNIKEAFFILTKNFIEQCSTFCHFSGNFLIPSSQVFIF